MQMKKITFTALLVIIGMFSYAQPVTQANASKKALKYLDEGVQRAMAKYLDKAVESFTNATLEEPNFVTAWIYLGDAYRNMKNDSMAVDSYTHAVDLDPDGEVWVYSKLAEAEGNMGMYDEALDHIILFLSNPEVTGDPRIKANRLKTNFTFAKAAVLNPVDFDPVNMGDAINSEYPEYFPSLSVDGSVLVMTRRIPVVPPVTDPRNPNVDQEDFYISYFRDGAWTTAENMGPPINTKLNQGAQNISADGRYLFYTSCDDDENGYGSCDLYYSIKIGNIWSNPENCGTIINSGDWESQPSVSADGRNLFFSSARPGTVGSYDLWMATMGDDGYWQEAVNLGKTINTPYSEQCPFIHPDGKTLYFSSEGHPGMGGSDLFYSKRDENGDWSKPVNLGYPINTKDREISLSVSANGTTAYFSSDRGKKLGELDIYSFELPADVQADPVTWVKAIVTDKITRLPLKANVQLVDIETGTMIATSISDPKTGEFLIVLPIGKDYSLFVQREGYLFHSENFSLLTAIPNEPFIINVALQPINAGEILTLKNIFFETASAGLLTVSQTELNKVVEMIEHGISADRITNKGFGESKPIDSNGSETGRANNRRTEIEILSL